MELINQQNIGQQYDLKLIINGIQVPTSNIQSFVLREWIFDKIVTLECLILDSGTFVELSPIYDESNVYIEFSKNEDIDKVKMEMSINAFEVERSNADNGMLYGIKFIAFQKTNDYFYPIRSRSFRNQTTSDVLKQISESSGFKYIEEIKAKDNQIWMQSNCSDYSFCEHLLKRSYVGLEDAPLFYTNRNNEAVYSSIKTKCNKKSKFVAINNDYIYLDNGNDRMIKELKEQFWKDVDTIFYKTDIRYKNLSSIFNKTNGYGIDFTYYDFRRFFDYQLSFNFAPLTKYSFQNKNNMKKFVNGLTYNTLPKNCHENYLLTKTQNMLIYSLFFGSYMQMSINPNTKINIGDKINVIVYDNISRIDNKTPNVDKVNSGEYIVGGISHDIKKDGLYNMNLTLFRGGINKSDIKEIDFQLIEGNSK